MNETKSIPDAQVRRLAESTFDRNVVVVAGAGTGKTTLLVNRFVHTLMREPHPAEVTEVVALTFTNKAATEMKIRLRERLTALQMPDHEKNDIPHPGMVEASELRERYGLSSDQIKKKAEAALHDLERAQIGTLHSFAAHLLRLHPIESGVDPAFREDDGTRFADHFDQEWEFWLDSELGLNGTNHNRWRRMLAEVGLAKIREMALALSQAPISFDELTKQIEQMEMSPELYAWILAMRTKAAQLLAVYDRPRRRKVESMLAGLEELLDVMLAGRIGRGGRLEVAQRIGLARDLGNAPTGWNERDFEEAKRLVRITKQIVAVDETLIRELLEVILPFVQRVQSTFLEQSWISFDGLLAGARRLLCDHPVVRDRLKRDYKAILVDEFQDTDPIQYETILFLAEHLGSTGRNWREVDLAPGRLFIVGDPKQSIYAFRRADIEAFEQVVKKIRNSGGVVYELTTNFRSDRKVLEVVNAIFDQLFQPIENVQPQNVKLKEQPDRRKCMPTPGVELRVVRGGEGEEDMDTVSANRMEAEQLARWLKHDLFGREMLIDAKGESTLVRPGQVALLFRKLTQVQEYLEALRRHGIPYVTDEEKHFYRRQEVIDLINLLRVVENPNDRIALVGVLRSPLGGVMDREIYELHERQAFDYRVPERLNGWHSPRSAAVRRLYDRLTELNRKASACSLPGALDVIFGRLPILELATGSLHGEQAMANLIKIRQIAHDLADRPHLTLTGFVDLMITKLAEQPAEAESALADDTVDAILVLTIHKAKGLEFPVVILPGLHHGAMLGSGDTPLISHDWRTGVLGISGGNLSSIGGVFVKEKLLVKEEAERRRVLYVGMTRARERLILFSGLPERTAQGTFLGLLQGISGGTVGFQDQSEVRIGPTSFSQRVMSGVERIPHTQSPMLRMLQPPPDGGDLLQRWEQRERMWKDARSSLRYLTPTQLIAHERDKRDPSSKVVEESDRRRLIGILAHRVLERWNFRDDPLKLEKHVEAVCEIGIPTEWKAEAEDITQDLRSVFERFGNSVIYTMLRNAEILGQEVPFVVPWEGDSNSDPMFGRDLNVMEGVIDLVYRLNGRVWVADYKMDRVEENNLEKSALRYQQQVQIYGKSVSLALGISLVQCQIIFLRNAQALEV